MSNKLFSYFKESKRELKKVTWPTKERITHDTIFILVVILIMAIFLGLVDFGLAKLLAIII